MPRAHILRGLPALLAGLTVLGCAPTGRPSDASGLPSASILAGNSTIELTSRHTGRSYRLFVKVPDGPPPLRGYPLMIVLDGDWYFRAADEIYEIQRRAGELPPAVIVGIGYPPGSDIRRNRADDLTPRIAPELLPPALRTLGVKGGGSDAFIRFIEEEVKTRVYIAIPVDRSCQAIFGHSLAGLTVLRSFFANPGSFRLFASASPSLWWNDKAVLAEARAFVARERMAGSGPRVLLTVGGLEQGEGADPERAARLAALQMIANQQEMARTLAPLVRFGIATLPVTFADETHNTVVSSALSRALRLGLNCPNGTRHSR